MAIIGTPIMAIMYSPAPQIIPTVMVQNVKTMSFGSLIAVLKRTILNAPNMPSDNAMFELIGSTTKVTTKPVRTSPTLKSLL